MVWGDVGPEGGGVGLEKEGGMEEGGWGVEVEGGGEVIICGQWDFAPPSFLSPQYLPHVQTQRLIKHTDDDAKTCVSPYQTWVGDARSDCITVQSNTVRTHSQSGINFWRTVFKDYVLIEYAPGLYRQNSVEAKEKPVLHHSDPLVCLCLVMWNVDCGNSQASCDQNVQLILSPIKQTILGN